MHINIDTLGVCAYELANESVSKSEIGVVSLLAPRCFSSSSWFYCVSLA